jgi:hypothetical protein
MIRDTIASYRIMDLKSTGIWFSITVKLQGLDFKPEKLSGISVLPMLAKLRLKHQEPLAERLTGQFHWKVAVPSGLKPALTACKVDLNLWENEFLILTRLHLNFPFSFKRNDS